MHYLPRCINIVLVLAYFFHRIVHKTFLVLFYTLLIFISSPIYMFVPPLFLFILHSLFCNPSNIFLLKPFNFSVTQLETLNTCMLLHLQGEFFFFLLYYLEYLILLKFSKNSQHKLYLFICVSLKTLGHTPCF